MRLGMGMGMGDEDEKMRARVLGYRMIEDFKNAERESQSEDEEEHDLGRGGGGVGYQLMWVFYVLSAMYVLRPKPKVK